MALNELDEQEPVLLITSSPAWEAVRDRLRGLKVAARLDVSEATIHHWDALLGSVMGQTYSKIYAVGGGLSADAAKYAASRLSLPLTVLPTVLSVDAFLTWASGIRRNGCVDYIPTRVPDRLVLDLAVIAAAPEWIRAAGVTDVLSIATGCWDWKFAHERNKNPAGMEFIPWVYQAAQAILQGCFDCAEAAGRGDQAGLKMLFDVLAMEVQLCNQVGHARPEEGSEHYFAYCAENFLGAGLPHGDLVGPGILLMASRQGQQTRELERCLRACHVNLNRISEPVAQQVLAELPAYCVRHRLPYGIAYEVTG
jgi:glycerol-1-phosphate dehydrogenase [NAD(P)+]